MIEVLRMFIIIYLAMSKLKAINHDFHDFCPKQYMLPRWINGLMIYNTWNEISMILEAVRK